MRNQSLAIVATLVALGGTTALAQTPEAGQRRSVQSIMAAERGETPEVRALVAGKDPNARDQPHHRTALMWSIFLNDRAAFDRFIAMPGADVNARDDEGGTALMQAAEFAMKYDTAELVEALIAKGASVNIGMDRPSFTPLMHAANGNAPGVAQAILAKLDPQYVDHRNSDGMTALIVAASVGATEVVHLLLDKGAVIEGVDDEGKTALIHGAGRSFPGSLATVELLLAKGANPNARDKNGKTPLSEAKKYGAPGVVEALFTAGAR